MSSETVPPLAAQVLAATGTSHSQPPPSLRNHESPLKRIRRRSRSLSDSCRRLGLMAFEQLPPWARDNPFIRTSYRMDFGWSRAAKSVCMLHNETLNVWTHLMGFAIVLFVLLMTHITFSRHGVDRLDLGVVVDPYQSSLSCYRFPEAALHITPQQLQLTAGGRGLPVDARSLHQLHAYHQCCCVDPPAEQQCLPGHDLLGLRFNPDSLCENSFDCPAADCTRLQQVTVAAGTRPEDLERLDWNGVETMARSLRHKVSQSFYASNDAYQRSLQLFVDYVTALEDSAAKAVTLVEERGQLNLELAKAFMAKGKVNFHHLARNLLQSNTTHHAADAMVQGFANFFWSHSRTNRSLVSDDPVHFPQLVLPESGQGVIPYLSLWPIAVFMVTALACLAFSTLFHLFCAVSEEIAVRMQTLDYAGICLLISGSGMPIIHYGFYCDPSWDLLYLTANLIMGSLGFLIVVMPSFRSHEYRHLKTGVFILMGFAAAAPLPQLALRYGLEVWGIVEDLLIMGALYLFGAMIYLTRVPERFSPGKFDILCHSHQLWHIMVFLAVLWHFQGSLRFYEWRMLRPCEAEMGVLDR